MSTTPAIALALGAFFLLVAIINGFRSRAERRRMDDIRSAERNGGTPEAPVHLESPFQDSAPAAPPEEPQPAETAGEGGAYVWD